MGVVDLESARAWTLPLGGDVGKSFSLESQAMQLSVGAYDLVKRARRPRYDTPRPADVDLSERRAMNAATPGRIRSIPGSKMLPS